MNLKTILVILTTAALIASLIWLYNDRSWEPLISSIVSLGALIAEVFTGGGSKPTKMKQKGGDNSTNYQSAGDMTINR